MKYKLLVLDVDGTLLNSEKAITARTQAALLKVQQMGIHIVLASADPPTGYAARKGSGTGSLRWFHSLI